jgi:hypothetical protein
MMELSAGSASHREKTQRLHGYSANDLRFSSEFFIVLSAFSREDSPKESL